MEGQSPTKLVRAPGPPPQIPLNMFCFVARSPRTSKRPTHAPNPYHIHDTKMSRLPNKRREASSALCNTRKNVVRLVPARVHYLSMWAYLHPQRASYRAIRHGWTNPSTTPSVRENLSFDIHLLWIGAPQLFQRSRPRNRDSPPCPIP